MPHSYQRDHFGQLGEGGSVGGGGAQSHLCSTCNEPRGLKEPDEAVQINSGRAWLVYVAAWSDMIEV